MADGRPPNRCRIVLITPPDLAADHLAAKLEAALAGGGDVASLIVPAYGLHEAAFQALTERLTPLAQAAGVAVIVAGDTRVADRVRADGVHLEAGPAALAEAIEKLQPRLMVGAGGIKTRDDALTLGQLRPDYVFFGRFGYDNTAEPHPRNLALAAWWAEMIEIPCIVLGGATTLSVERVADTGADFVALSKAVFGVEVDAAAALSDANARLDQKAPRFAG